ncbi:MAG TPA: PDZ domain-containing protein [Devosia sp.]|nr:PDZ domain-containing protein [Devosia sp.]
MSLLSDLSDAASSLAERVAPRIVAVRGADGRSSSGFIWRTGLAVTAEEALEGEDEADLLLDGGGTLKASLVGRDPSTDVALLRLDTAEFVEWTAAPAVKPASFALIAGRAEGSLLAALTAVSEVGPAWRSLRGGEIAARIVLGTRLGSRSEGAAIVAPDGSLIGMGVSSPRRRALVIPASTIARAVTTLAEKGYVPRGWLGVMLHPVGTGAGAIILGVEQNSPAEKAGLLVGDVITTWNGEAIGSVGNLAQRLAAGTVNATVKLGVLRAGDARDIDVTLGERPRK